MKKLVAGIVVSAVFIYFSVRGVDMGRVLAGLGDARYGYLVPVFGVFVLVSILRSLRWGIILGPIRRIEQRQLYPVTCVGFMSVVLLPMRMGEFVRPYLLSAKGLIPFGSGLATVFVERVLDVVTVLGIFLLVVLNSEVPGWLLTSGYTAMVGFSGMIAFMCVLYFRTDMAFRVLGPLLKILPGRLHERLEDLLRKFVAGFKVIGSPGRLLVTVGLSAAIWIATGMAIYWLFFFIGFDLTLLAAFLVLVVNIVGISLPTAPGMLGNFQYSVIVALAIFGVPKDEAFVYSMVYYFFGVGCLILLGLAFLPSLDVSVRDTLRNIKQALGGA